MSFGEWSVLTTAFLIVLYLALGGVLLSSLLHMANAQWRFQVRHLACALAALFPVAFVLLVILLLNGESTFPWLAHAGEGEHDLGGWHNYTFLVTREIIGFLLIAGLFLLFIRYQHQSEIDSSYKAQRRFRNIALLIPFAFVPYASMVAWDFEMTMSPGWHSSTYAPYHFISNFHLFLGFFTVFLFFLHRSGRLTRPFSGHIFNFLAQFMLAFTILWTYFFFHQFLIIWYGRLPFETERVFSMMYQGLGPLWWTFFSLKSIIPFCTFLFTANRHNPPVILIVACGIIIGTWIERYTWISGSVDSSLYHMPMTSLFDILATIAVVVASWIAVSWALKHYRLIRSDKQPQRAVPVFKT